MENEKVMVPTNDYVFKRLFGHVGNEEITKGLISAVLKQNIESIILNESPILEKDLKDDKVGILDIKAKLDGDKMCNIEMQVVQESNIGKRLMFYWSKLYSSGIREGEKYKVLNKTIAILIANFELDSIKEIPKYHTKWEIREEEYSKVILTNVFELHIIEIPKLINQLENNLISKDDELSLWIRFINNPENIGEKDMENNNELKQAKEELDKLQQDAREKELAYLRDKHIRDIQAVEEYGYEQGMKDGVKQGEDKKQKEIILNLYKMNMKIEEICKAVNLSKEEVEKIIKESEEI